VNAQIPQPTPAASPAPAPLEPLEGSSSNEAGQELFDLLLGAVVSSGEPLPEETTDATTEGETQAESEETTGEDFTALELLDASVPQNPSTETESPSTQTEDRETAPVTPEVRPLETGSQETPVAVQIEEPVAQVDDSGAEDDAPETRETRRLTAPLPAAPSEAPEAPASSQSLTAQSGVLRPDLASNGDPNPQDRSREPAAGAVFVPESTDEETARTAEPTAAGRDARDAAPVPVRTEVDVPILRTAEPARVQTSETQASTRPIPELTTANESEVVEGARVLLRNGGGAARIQLHPPQLGGLDIRVTLGQGTAQISFVADRAAVAELIHQHLPELRHVLQTHGLTLERVDVAYRGSGDLTDEEDRDREEALLEWDETTDEQPSDPETSEKRTTLVSPHPDFADPGSTMRSASRLASLGTVDVRV
jgi:flagellar hook-length control protein FliK